MLRSILPRKIVKSLACLLLGLLLVASASIDGRAQEGELCDLLAGDGGPTPVPLEAIDAEPAMAACAAAVAAAPGEPRFTYQYARALERAGRIADAQRLYGWGARDGYAPATEAVIRLAGASERTAAWTEADRSTLEDDMAALSVAARRIANSLPPDPSDPLTVIAAIGVDRSSLVAWVAAETRLLAYSGSLRGARGVLSDRAGNSLDRALALAALLTAAGEEVRLARASLSETQAEALLAAAVAASLPAQVAIGNAEEAQALLVASGLRPDVVEAAVTGATAIRTRIDTTVPQQTALILPAIHLATEAISPAAIADQRTRSIEALRDHFWVQVREGATWADLDPDAVHVGQLTAAETLDPTALPSTLRHSVTLRVIVELQSASERREETLLTWSGFTADAHNVLLTLWHDTDMTDPLSQLVPAGAAPADVLAAVAATTRWTPFLKVGDTVHTDRLFTIDGEVRTADINFYTPAGQATGAGFAGAAALLGPGAAPISEPATPTAEWIEVEIAIPGASPHIERRVVFDLVGPAARAAGAAIQPSDDQRLLRALRLIGVTDILVLGATPSAIEAARPIALGISQIADNIRVLTLQPNTPEFADVTGGLRLGLSLHQLARARFSTSDPTAISAPNVVMHHARLGVGPEGGIGLEDEIDFVFNEVWAPGDTFAARLQQGIKDTVLEAALLGDGVAVNTAVAMVHDLRAGDDWAVIGPGDSAWLDALPREVGARIEADLAAGYVVVAPGEAGNVISWWRIDPLTGATLGMARTGGGAAAEWTTLMIQAVSGGLCLAAVGTTIAFMVAGAGGTSTVAGGALLVCMSTGAFGIVGGGVTGGVTFGLGAAGAGVSLGMGLVALLGP